MATENKSGKQSSKSSSKTTNTSQALHNKPAVSQCDGGSDVLDMNALHSQVDALRSELGEGLTYYASDRSIRCHEGSIPAYGAPPRHVTEMVEEMHLLDFNPRLNTSSYVNVVSEPEERDVALLGIQVNIADQTVYPASFRLHNEVLNMVGNLWHCPKNKEFYDSGHFAGAGTVGSTEACLLAGLVLKFRWRKWYSSRHPDLTTRQIRGLYPNLVMSSMYQACWEKFFNYMDIEPRFVYPKTSEGVLMADEAVALCDELTIGIVCILGNHYSGQYDPVWEVDKAVQTVNSTRGWQIGIHVDAASGGFIAPFQAEVPVWDFRLPSVLSISASGHKFGQSVCGTGWVVWRGRHDLCEHIAVNVSYLGGNADSYTLNFSRPATGIYVQFYKFMRLGLSGYQKLCDNMMANTKFLRDGLKAMKFKGKRRFVILDAGDEGCLPVVCATLNPDLNLPYDCLDLQRGLGARHWYVSGYRMSFKYPESEQSRPLFRDSKMDSTMFRIVVKSNLTRNLATDLLNTMNEVLKYMDSLGEGYEKIHHALPQRNNHHRAC